MASELKVYNQFREVILHVRLTSGNAPKLLVVDATEEMRSAVNSLMGQDFDRTVGRGGELRRFTARWGSPEYAQVLADYFGNNFGWSTALVETVHPSSVRIKVDANQAEKNAMAAAAGVGASSFGYAWRNLPATEQLGNEPVFNSLIAGTTGQQSSLGELR